MVAYISHIIWRFIRYKPDEYRLLDVRHNVMKNLILGDCDNLIKFILFGNEDDSDHKNCKTDQKRKFIIKHIPRSELWKKGRDFVKSDDLIPFEREGKEVDERAKPTNDMELAIYHCKGKISVRATLILISYGSINKYFYFIGRELKDTIIVAYLLEYYSQH